MEPKTQVTLYFKGCNRFAALFQTHTLQHALKRNSGSQITLCNNHIPSRIKPFYYINPITIIVSRRNCLLHPSGMNNSDRIWHFLLHDEKMNPVLRTIKNSSSSALSLYWQCLFSLIISILTVLVFTDVCHKTQISLNSNCTWLELLVGCDNFLLSFHYTLWTFASVRQPWCRPC